MSLPWRSRSSPTLLRRVDRAWLTDSGADGPFDLLRWHRGLDPHAQARVAGTARPPRRRPDPVRLWRGDAAAARGDGRFDGADRGISDPLSRRPLARAPRRVEDVRPARAGATAARLRAGRTAGTDGA